MTTLKQISGLAAPLLSRNPDLALLKDVIVIRPVEHVLRFVLIERTGSSDVFDPRWGSSILFRKLLHFPIGESVRLRRGQSRSWRWSDRTIIEEFTEAIESDVLPKLRAVRTLQDYVDLSLSYDCEKLTEEWATIMVSSIATGDLDNSRRLLSSQRGARYIEALNSRRSGLGTRLAEMGNELDADDRTALAGQLRATEAETVQTLGLLKVWSRTPFPLEECFEGR